MIASAPSRETLLRVARSLPPAPRILVQLGRVVRDPNSGIDEVTTLLRRDVALTARIIRISNSAVYGAGAPSASLEEALARIGLDEVYRVAALAASVQVADGELPFYGVGAGHFRENALLTALIVEQFAPCAGLPAGSAYTAGLLRCVGRVAIDRWMRGPHGASRPHDFAARGHVSIEEWETAHAGLTAEEAAAHILEDWHFPEGICSAIRHHHRPEGLGALAAALNLAAGAAERCGHGWPGEWSFWSVTPEKLQAAQIDEEILESTTRRALEMFGPLRVAVS
jgi:HD-like signal output (HDOD) protein